MLNESSMTTTEVLSLLRSKNRCLEKLKSATARFLEHPLEAIVVPVPGDDPLEKFDEERMSIVRAIELYDRKVDEILRNLPRASIKSENFVNEAREIMAEGQLLLAEVLATDETVFARIREAQNRVQKLGVDSRRSKETLSKFKSSWVTENGEEMDQTL